MSEAKVFEENKHKSDKISVKMREYGSDILVQLTEKAVRTLTLSVKQNTELKNNGSAERKN